MKKYITLILGCCLWSFYVQAQFIDIDDFYLNSSVVFSDTETDKINELTEAIQQELSIQLKAQGFTVLPRKTTENLATTTLYTNEVRYNPNTDKLIFGIITNVYRSKDIQITTYSYDVVERNGIKRLIPSESHKTQGVASEWLQNDQLPNLVGDIIQALFQGKRGTEISVRETPTMPRTPLIKGDENPKNQTIYNGENKNSIASSCQVASIATTGGGILMLGTSIYLRGKAVKIYNEEYYPVVGAISEDEILRKARRPNRIAHGIGAAGILTTSIGAYFWIKCTRKNKRRTAYQPSVFPQNRLQLTPLFDYNSVSNTGTYTAKMTYLF